MVTSAPAAPVEMPGTSAHSLTWGGLTRRVFLGFPAGDAPMRSGDVPVLVVLDGLDPFMLAMAALRSRSRPPAPIAIVVGIDDVEDHAGQRLRDFTPAVSAARLGTRPNGNAWPPTGGADAFMDFLAEGLAPWLSTRYGLGCRIRSLFGHSLGGLFGLYAALTRPALFSAVVASSPSIWFGQRVIREALRPAPPEPPRLLVTVGSREQSVPDGVDPSYAGWVRRNRMVENAQEITEDLRGWGWPASFHCFADETHASVRPIALSHALRVLLQPQAA